MHQSDDNRKQEVIEAINDCQNPYLLFQVRQLTKRSQVLDPVRKLCKNYPWLAEEIIPRDMRIKTGCQAPQGNPLASYLYTSTPILYGLALVCLIAAAALVNLLSHEGENIAVAFFQSRVALLYGLIWLVFVGDFLVLTWLIGRYGNRKAKKEIYLRLLVILFPPLHMGSRHLLRPRLQWIPFLGWCYRNEGLLVHLKGKFSVPMILIALLILPILIIEWQFYEPVEQYLNADLSFVLDMAQGFIWLAFAYEFILMISISQEKIAYAQKNWIDLLIILLPFIAFVRTIRLIKIARLSQIARGYKLRGLLLKARQGLFFAGIFHKLLTVKPEFQIKSLKKKLEKNQKEREELEEELLLMAKLLQKGSSGSVEE
ncbi:hypothetical protein [Pleomorphovibrio marinus]|uniref:hypothetical protein n=1 Tax=Pleomorphovibrio marinus TaxID=2164132 RepID=UPI000E0BF38D|nr:hypothetical protein [Pleomorphovibrio marinus]